MRRKRCSSVFFVVLALFTGVNAAGDRPGPGRFRQPEHGTARHHKPRHCYHRKRIPKRRQGPVVRYRHHESRRRDGQFDHAFKGSTQLTANITVAPDAVISSFDIVVTNANGRTGKGTDKFAVTVKGTPVGCTTSGTPIGFTLVTQLNPVQPNGAALITTLRLGNAIRVRPLDLNRDGIVDTLVAFVTSGQTGSEATYVFLLNPTTGLPQATNPVTGAAWQNPLVLLTGPWSTVAEAGDVNGDGVPDFLMLNNLYLFVGTVSGANSPAPYTLTYTAYPILAPPGGYAGFGASIAIGDLDGDGADEVAVGATGGGKKNPVPPVVFI